MTASETKVEIKKKKKIVTKIGKTKNEHKKQKPKSENKKLTKN